ncbi:CLUMA_CG004928, isoform A [Clunio marinus]|uniref:CLUMA_CG004928, isoform A n=1 Tax=Clunio marinus TaxID=568069 RepID=A0A1J1HT58_9DIPT|nr:CLUMA_CG004928, isoform A [Clunio marinus]
MGAFQDNKILNFMVLILLISTKLCHADEDFDDTKQKRAAGGGNVGLFPFPRVGRSDPDLLAEFDSPSSNNLFENYDDLGRYEVKRQGLVPFPRVGRSGSPNSRFYHQQLSDYIKRSMSGATPSSSNMWFGPRLGKRALNQGENM